MGRATFTIVTSTLIKKALRQRASTMAIRRRAVNRVSIRLLPSRGLARVPGVDDSGDAPGFDVVHVAGDAHLRREQGRGEQALDVGGDGGVRVADRGGFQRRLVRAGRLGGLAPEAGIGEEAGPALRMVNDRDFDALIAVHRPAGQPPAEEGEVGDLLDDGLGDASPRVAQDGGVAEPEPEGDRGVDPVVEAGDDDHLRGGQAERRGSVGAGELLIPLKQRGHPAGHRGSVPVWSTSGQ